MERIIQKTLVLVALAAAAGPALGEVVFVAPPPSPSADEETYPESRFGQPTQPALPGTRFAAVQQAEDRAARTEEYRPASGPNRSPAGSTSPAPAESYRTVVEDDSPAPGSRAPAARGQYFGDVVPDKGKGVQEVALIAGDLGFFPKTVFVTRDIPVRMFVTGAARNTLCIMMDSFHIRKQLKSQEIQEIAFTPNTPGTYRFYCPVNGMEGRLVVKDLAAQR